LSLFSHLAWLELRQQLRSHVFWIVFAVSLLMVLGAAAIDALRLDAASGLGSGAA
jgi:ABC-type Na+ efflux pump permease subunit